MCIFQSEIRKTNSRKSRISCIDTRAHKINSFAGCVATLCYMHVSLSLPLPSPKFFFGCFRLPQWTNRIYETRCELWTNSQNIEHTWMRQTHHASCSCLPPRKILLSVLCGPRQSRKFCWKIWIVRRDENFPWFIEFFDCISFVRLPSHSQHTLDCIQMLEVITNKELLRLSIQTDEHASRHSIYFRGISSNWKAKLFRWFHVHPRRPANLI